MSKFHWDPTQDQTYTTADGNQTIKTQTIDKVAGKSFTMNAMEQTLEINLLLSQPTTVFRWGVGGSLAATNIDILQGTCRITCQPESSSNDAALYMNDEYDSKTNVSTAGTGALELIGFDEVNFSEDGQHGTTDFSCNVSATGNSHILIKGCDIVTILSNLTIQDTASIDIYTSELQFGGGFGQEVIISGTPDTHSFYFDSSAFSNNNTGMISSIFFKGNSITKAISKSMAFSDNFIEENAKVFIETDYYTSTKTVSLGKGTPGLSILPLNKKFVFDLDVQSSVIYPEGMFNFLKRDGKNEGVLTMSTNSNNGFGFEQMLSRKMIYINDSPATTSVEFDNIYSETNGNMIIKLRNI
ncbi:hypothetical protein [Enterobacter ludwigii]|jgi:hypothetical protein|uniref:hypothetical protein n=1 Tax=Enterobacter ludwigii TaxID=299767 RepID=UPI0003D7D8C7|nr:hypothetical protein [Enterobacter ludwigii]AHE73594.1 hypothetical protein M942_24720 [Enterobacter ludwigii]